MNIGMYNIHVNKYCTIGKFQGLKNLWNDLEALFINFEGK